MNKFNRLSHIESVSQGHLPSRKFPKKQYQKLNHCLWFGLIIIIILISSVSFYGGIYYSNQHLKETNQIYKQNKQNQHHQVNHQSINHKLIQPNKTKLRHKKNNKSLLKDWLVKLRYSNTESNNIMNIYKNAQSFRKQQINHQLNNINRQPINKQAKAKQVIRLLEQYQMIDQNKLAP